MSDCMSNYILHHSDCNRCVVADAFPSFYNPICCHCPYATFSKNATPSFKPMGKRDDVSQDGAKNNG